jgi:hypothetical protein
MNDPLIYERTIRIEIPNRILRVSSIRQRAILGLFCVALFGFFVYLSIIGQAWWAGLIHLFFMLLGVWIFISGSAHEMDSEKIAYRSLFGSGQIRWDEIRHIEHGWQTMVLYGVGKRLRTEGPGNWAGDDAEHMRLLLSIKTEEHQIPVQRTWRVAFSRSKNV